MSIYSSDGNDVVMIAEEVLVLDTSNEVVGDGAPGNSGSFDSTLNRPRLAWVTLAVEPESVQQLIAASTSRQLHLVLPGGVSDE